MEQSEGSRYFGAREQEAYRVWLREKFDETTVRELMRRSLRRAKRFISQDEACNDFAEDEVRGNLDEMDLPRFTDLMIYDFYDYHVMEAVRCFMSAVMARDEDPQGIGRWFTDLREIGEASAFGRVFAPLFFGQRPFVIKMARRDNIDLSREWAVGLVLNRMRRFIPNFVYTYIGFQCSKAVMSEDGKRVVRWCDPRDHRGEVDYLVLERVFPSISLERYIIDRNHNLRQILDKLIQVIFAMAMAHERHRFGHFDLHTQNILVRTPVTTRGDPFAAGDVQINYNYGGEDWFVRSDGVATIIDYGFSVVTLPGDGQTANWDITYHGIPAGRSFPLYDIHTLIMYSISNARRRGGEVYQQLQRCFAFFDRSQSYEDYIRQVEGTGLMALTPLNPATKTVSYRDLLLFLQELYPREIAEIVRKEPWEDIPALFCDGGCYAGTEEPLTEAKLLEPQRLHDIAGIRHLAAARRPAAETRQYLSPEAYLVILDDLTAREIAAVRPRLIELRGLIDAGALPRDLSRETLENPRAVNEYLATLREMLDILRSLADVATYAAIARSLRDVYPERRIRELTDAVINAADELAESAVIEEVGSGLLRHDAQFAGHPSSSDFNRLFYSIQNTIDKIRHPEKTSI